MNQMNRNIIEIAKEIGTQTGKEIGKEITTQIGKKIGKEIGEEIGKEIGKVISNKFTVISLKLSDISKKIDSNSSSGSLGRSKNIKGNTSIHSFAKDSLENDSSSSHYNYKKRTYQ